MSLDIYFINSLGEEVKGFNITHNLSNMATQSGLYRYLWGAQENGFKNCSHIVEGLERGLQRLKTESAFFKTMDAKNGWGTYDQFVPWVEKVLRFCEENPTLEIRISK